MRYRYSVSPENQLLLSNPLNKSAVKLAGRFKIDKSNRLYYKLNSAFESKRKITFSGNWRLNDNYELEFVLDRASGQFQGDTLAIKGEIICADRGVLAFEAKSSDKNGLLHVQVLELGITWFSDDKNRLCFLVRGNKSEKITLQCSWKIGKNKQIQYVYQKTDLKSGRRIRRSFSFEGFWSMSSRNRLVYIFRFDSASLFEFRASLETPTVYPQEKSVKYRIGIGLKNGKREENTLSLYGSWKLNRDLGVSFSVDYGGGGRFNTEFGTTLRINSRDEAELTLKNAQNQPFGITLILTHRFLKSSQAEAFFRLKSQGRNRRIDAGISFPF